MSFQEILKLPSQGPPFENQEQGGRRTERRNKEESEREVRSEDERDPPWFVLKGPWAGEYRWPLDVACRSYRQRAAQSITDQNPFFKADICDKGDSAYSRFLIGHYCVFSISNLLY